MSKFKSILSVQQFLTSAACLPFPPSIFPDDLFPFLSSCEQLMHSFMETFSFSLQYNTTIDWSSLTMKECLKYGGQLVGNNCEYVPDITLMSFILFFGTYTCSMALKKFKTSRYFPTTVSISAWQSYFFYSFGVQMSACLLVLLPHTHREECFVGKPVCMD